MERRIEAAIRTVIQFFDDHHYRYALIGGIALAQWGVVRATLGWRYSLFSHASQPGSRR